MEDLGSLASGELPLEESHLLPLLPTEQEQLSLAETPVVYKAHAAVGAAIFIEGFFKNSLGDIQKLPLSPVFQKDKLFKLWIPPVFTTRRGYQTPTFVLVVLSFL